MNYEFFQNSSQSKAYTYIPVTSAQKYDWWFLDGHRNENTKNKNMFRKENNRKQWIEKSYLGESKMIKVLSILAIEVYKC